jgi:hypothetical protein
MPVPSEKQQMRRKNDGRDRCATYRLDVDALGHCGGVEFDARLAGLFRQLLVALEKLAGTL